jgi:GMC oxidoreductase
VSAETSEAYARHLRHDLSDGTWDRKRHDVKNLFIVDGGVFVTSGGVNPTSTIQALALYIADSIKKRLATLFD